MPRCSVTVSCNTEAGEGYSLHEFPINDAQTCVKWTQGVQQKQHNWPGPTAGSSVVHMSKALLHLSALWKAGAIVVHLH